MGWVKRITSEKAGIPHSIQVGDEVVIALTRTEDGAVRVVVDAPNHLAIICEQDQTAKETKDRAHGLRENFTPKERK